MVMWGLAAKLLMASIDRTWEGDDRDAYDQSVIGFQVIPDCIEHDLVAVMV